MSTADDVVIRNALIVDGTGGPAFEASLAIRGDRIARVGNIAERGATEIDARGLSVAPGFINVHSHDDWAVFVTPEMDFKVMQGVTTDIVGNCGMGAAPNPSAAVIFRALHGPAVSVPDWTDYAGYLRAFDASPASINVAVLVGHGSLRLGAMGNANREPTAAEMATMRAWLNNAIDAGAVGLSTGLVYEPGRFARTEEIIELAHQMRGSGALYASHMRNEARGLLDSVRETIRIGKEAGVPVQISHHKASGEENWGKVRESLKLIDEARASRPRCYRRSVSLYRRQHRFERRPTKWRPRRAWRAAAAWVPSHPNGFSSRRFRRIRNGKATASMRSRPKWISARWRPRAKSLARIPAPW